MSEPMSLIRTTGDAIVNLAAKNALITKPQPDDYLMYPKNLTVYPYRSIASKYADKYWSWNYASGVITTIYALDHSTSYSGRTLTITSQQTTPSEYNFTDFFGGQVANGSVSGTAFNDGVLRKSTLDALLVDMQRLGRFELQLRASNSDWTLSGSGKYTHAPMNGSDEVITKSFTNTEYGESVLWTSGYGFHTYPMWNVHAGGKGAKDTSGEWSEELVTTTKCEIALPYTISTSGAMLLCLFNCTSYNQATMQNNDKTFMKFYPLTVGASGRSIRLPAFNITELTSIKEAVYGSMMPSKDDTNLNWFNVYMSSYCLLVFNMA